ncbi:MAG: 50S ribosomal protein L32 [Actinobacteria bacterium]|nr:50S ribosomal protein L32 [Actinomycetota bacterium]MCL5887017.1 50S ribosomal protein L32 [Actinomycetota bacterium]
MPVPKRKKGRAKTASRRATHIISGPSIAMCPQCHQAKLPHRVCASCGYYKGKEVIDTQ